MAPLSITLNLLEIGKYKLNLNEYLTLLKLQYESEERSFPFVMDDRFFERLLRDKFLELKEGGGYKLGPEGIKVFKGEEDLFEEFYTTFPNRVPTEMGFRVISAAGLDTVSAKATRSIWDKIVKHKPYLQRRIIENLKRELNSRRANNSLAYLQNIDTWLRQATWEKWDDIPEEKKSSGSYTKL